MDIQTQKLTQDSSIATRQSAHQSETEGLIAGQTIRAYFGMIALPVAVAIFAVVAVQFADLQSYVDWLVYAIVAGYIGWQVSQRSGAVRAQAMTAGAMGLAMVALTGAVAQFVAVPRVYHFFAIITEPMLLTVVGGVVAGAMFWLMKDGMKKMNTLQLNKK